MWLISGGSYQGKLQYAMGRTGINERAVVDGKECCMQDLLEKPLVNHFHLWIDRMLKEEHDIYSLVDQIIAGNPGIVIIVDELGCGIVPIDPYDRMYRELTGRICCKLAKEAEEVHRVIGGIGWVIKHA